MELLQSVRQETVSVFGVDLRCHILSDGKRIIEAADVEALFAAMAGSGLTGDEIDEISCRAFNSPRPIEGE